MEVTDHIWVKPQRVLKEQELGLSLPFPTLSNMKVLAQFSSVDELITSTLDKKVPTIQPTVTIENGEMKIRI